jgi:hypothetical protein
MNLILHVVKKDLRRFWIPIALFAVVLAVNVAIGALLRWKGDSFDGETFDRLALYINFASVIRGIVIFVLVAAFVHEDPLVGTQAFWMTKPISGLRLLGAKALSFLLVFVLLLAFVNLPWWLACSFGWRDIGLAVWHTTAVSAMAAILALPFAVLTRAFARYLAALLVTAVLIMVVSTMHFAATLKGPPTPPGVFVTRFWLASGLAVIAVAALVVHQYRTRRFWPSLIFFAAAFATILSISVWWPWELSPSWSSRKDFDPALTGQIELTAHHVKLQYLNPTLSTYKAYAVSTSFTAIGVPKHDALLPLSSRQRWLWIDGTKLDRAGSSRDRPGVFDQDVARLLGLREPVTDPAWIRFMAEKYKAQGWKWNPPSSTDPSETVPYWFTIHAIPSIPADLAQRLRDESAAYEFDGNFQLLQPALVLEEPLRVGKTIEHAAFGVSMRRSWMDEKRGLAVSLVEWTPASTMRALPPFGITESSFRPDISGDLWLVNRSRGNFVPEGPAEYRRIDIAGVSVIRRVAYFHPHRHWDSATNKWIEDPDWFQDLSLAMFTLRPIATFHRHLKIAHLKVLSPAGVAEEGH